MPPVVVVADQGASDGVGGEGGVVQVHPFGLLQHVAHAAGPPAGGEQEAQEQGREQAEQGLHHSASSAIVLQS